MIKKTTKITSLIVSAASIVSMVPAMAATTKVEEKDGTVYNAVAYKEGKLYIDGDIDDKGEGVYFLDNGKYTDLDDLDTGSDAEVYGEKYAKLDDGDYYVDLETGKVNDEDDLAEEDLDDSESNLIKKIKKDSPEDRYYLNEDDKPVVTSSEAVTLPYAENWYKYSVQNKDQDGNYTVYTDVSGKYIDVDYDLGKIKLVTDGSVATIENTVDTEKINGAKYGAKINHVETITQDKDYIYRIAEIQITKDGAIIIADDVKNEPLFFGGKNDRVGVYTDTKGSIKVFQRISKEQNSDEIDDAKYPKTTETYFINEYEDYDKGSKTKSAEYKKTLSDDGYNDDEWTVVDGKIVNYGIDNSDNFKAQTYNLKTKAGFYYVDTDDSDFDVDDTDEYSVAIDKDGQLWVLDNGKVKLYKTDGDFETIYKVDGAMKEISVYDKDNLIAWNDDEEIYCIVGGKSSTDVKEEEVPAVTTGWIQDATTGTWSYVKADGTKAIGWLQSPASGVWYYMDATGTMMTNGWIQDAGKWYFVDATGAMKTGWVYTGGAWYYLASNGAMQTGWVQTGGKWYYCNASGAMLSNTTVDGYVLGADGAWIK
ncbi:MAG: N-acetylmuramoyl-L-alanine amidase family protein [Clostridium butyricum]|nr:N-acetylmuramoyl-L-alanine amidase family protein [Clostridium butyricum]